AVARCAGDRGQHRQAAHERRGAADWGAEAGTALKFTKAQTQVLLFFSARYRGRASRIGPARTMMSHLEVNWGQGAYRPAHPPGAPSAAVRSRIVKDSAGQRADLLSMGRLWESAPCSKPPF